jgi:hypothetical protein
MTRDKEISLRQIVEDERKIIEKRFKKDLQSLKDENAVELQKLQSIGTNTKNKNE